MKEYYNKIKDWIIRQIRNDPGYSAETVIFRILLGYMPQIDRAKGFIDTDEMYERVEFQRTRTCWGSDVFDYMGSSLPPPLIREKSTVQLDPNEWGRFRSLREFDQKTQEFYIQISNKRMFTI